MQAGETAGLVKRCREESTEGVKDYAAQFLSQEEAEKILRKELPDHELCLFVKNQESIVQTGLEELKKSEKSSSGFTEEKGRVHHTVRTAYKRISEITDQF